MAAERRSVETSWLEDTVRFVVCTSAFGLGINKPDVRWIVHFHPPQLLSEYLQEVGRGGRDGKPTDALMLISEPTGWLDPEDRQRRQFFVNRLRKQYQQAQKIAQKIPPQGEIKFVEQQFKAGDMALAILHSAGQLEWLDPFHYQLSASPPSDRLSQLQVARQESHSQMTRYLVTRKCRWQFLLNAFGFREEALGLKCGHCDNCR
jgi:ATP-dependent DNA helicase RecQ